MLKNTKFEDCSYKTKIIVTKWYLNIPMEQSI